MYMKCILTEKNVKTCELENIDEVEYRFQIMDSNKYSAVCKECLKVQHREKSEELMNIIDIEDIAGIVKKMTNEVSTRTN